MDRLFVAIGAISGFVGVAAGAFGAHGLAKRLTPEMLAVFETGARYQMFHAVALVALGAVAARWPAPGVTATGWLWIVGTVIFSGSLYVLALTGITKLGAITPIGGLALLAGWAALAWTMLTPAR